MFIGKYLEECYDTSFVQQQKYAMLPLRGYDKLVDVAIATGRSPARLLRISAIARLDNPLFLANSSSIA